MSETAQRNNFELYNNGELRMEEEKLPKRSRFTQEHTEFIKDLFFKEEDMT